MKLTLNFYFFCLLISLIIIGPHSYAQNLYKLEVQASQSSDKPLISKVKYKSNYPTISLRKKAIDQVLMQLYAKAYVLATIDSSKLDNKLKTVYISLNDKYIWKELKKGNLDAIAINDIGFDYRDFHGTDFNYNRLLYIEESLIKHYENHGYPFASIQLDSIRIKNEEISAAFNLTKGPLFKIDTVLLNGFTAIHPNYIYQLIDIKPGDIYNEEKISKINHQLASMSFAQESKPFTVLFQAENASLNLNLKKRKSNIFDGIIGFQPKSGIDKSLMLTGNLRLKLINSFKRGELISLNWRSPGGGSQNLDMAFAYPYLFNSPIGIDYQFKLFKQDTNFINIRNTPGILFIINGMDYIKIAADLFTSSTLTKSLVNGVPLNDDLLDMRSALFSIEAKLTHLDYIFNPRKGWMLNISGGYGNKKIIQQHDINESYYDSIPINSSQVKIGVHLEYFIPLFKRQTFRIATKSELLKGDYLLSNELFRIGGFSDLHGFDEESIYASAYSILTLEWRLLLERNSYLNLFWNGAYVENSSGKSTTYDQPMGFGAGFSFETKAGIFSLSYALGRQQGNPIEFSAAKIHFGYMALF